MGEKKSLNIGLIGFGNIGAAVIDTLNKNKDIINKRCSLPLFIKRIADIDIATKRNVDYDQSILTKNADDIFNDKEIDVVIELVGGVGIAKVFVEKALASGKHVVTANKALISHHGPELFELAEKNNVLLLFEASVGAGIPIIRALENSFCPNVITKICGILNGTCNYILTKMEDEKKDFGVVLNEAQKLGYAEPDPTFDVEGYDTAHKLSILASLAFGMDIRAKDVYTEGIRDIQPIDIESGKMMGYRIKLLGIATLEDGKAEARVHPTFVPIKSQIAAISDVFNGIMIEGIPIGKQILIGRGAGQGSTSSGVISDLMTLSSVVIEGGAGREKRLVIPNGSKQIKPSGELRTQYYIRMQALDVPGTMAKITAILGDNHISIAQMMQLNSDPGGFVNGFFLIHETKEENVQKAISALQEMKCIKGKPFVLRVENI